MIIKNKKIMFIFFVAFSFVIVCFNLFIEAYDGFEANKCMEQYPDIKETVGEVDGMSVVKRTYVAASENNQDYSLYRIRMSGSKSSITVYVRVDGDVNKSSSADCRVLSVQSK